MAASIVENTCNRGTHSCPICPRYHDFELALLPIWIHLCDVAVQLRQQGAPAWHIAAAHQTDTAEHKLVEIGLVKVLPLRHQIHHHECLQAKRESVGCVQVRLQRAESELANHLLPVVVPTWQHREVFACRCAAQHKSQEENARLLISYSQLVCRPGPLSPQCALNSVPVPIHELAMRHLMTRHQKVDAWERKQLTSAVGQLGAGMQLSAACCCLLKCAVGVPRPPKQ